MRSHLNLNKVGSRDKMSLMQQKCHWLHYAKITHIQRYTPLFTRHACDRWNENLIDFFSLLSNKYISNISNLYNPDVNLSLVYQTIYDHMFSDPKWDHIFSYFCFLPGLYIFLIVCGNLTLTLNTGSCWNIL